MKRTLKEQTALKKEFNQTLSNYRKTPVVRRTQGYISGKLDSIKATWAQFKRNHAELVTADTDSIKDEKVQAAVVAYAEGDQFQEFEEIYSEFYGELMDGLVTSSEREQVEPPKAILQLPTLEIPKFDGQYASWRAFHDRFVSLIHHEDRLSTVDKMHYLKSSLTGDAKKDLDSFDTTAANYTAAWEVLCNRYDKKRLLIYAQLKLLFNQPKIRTESYREIRATLDELQRIQHNLKALKVDIASWDPIFVFITAQKLPEKTRNLWEQLIAKSDELPSLKELITFMEQRYRSLEATKDIHLHKAGNNPHKAGKNHSRLTTYYTSQQDNPITNKGKSQTAYRYHKAAGQNRNGYEPRSSHPEKVNFTNHCPMCRSNHFLTQCQQFRKLSVAARKNWLTEHEQCERCLRNHKTAECTIKYTCKTCGNNHHSLLHDRTGHENSANSPRDNTVNETTVTQCNHIKDVTQTMLATALVKVKGRIGRELTLRALIDPGSQNSFITEAAYQSIRAQTFPTNLSVLGVAETQVATANKVARFTLLSTTKDYKSSIDAYVIKSITKIFPPERTIKKHWPHIDGLELADPKFMNPGRIDILLGVSVYADIIRNGLRKGMKGAPVALKTGLGWIVFGDVQSANTPSKNISLSAFTTQHDVTLEELSRQIKGFWECEEIPKERQFTGEERQCEEFYDKTTIRKPSGQYEVRIPFKDGNPPSLGESRRQAVSRLLQSEKKLAQRTELKDSYQKCLQEYIDLNHMSSARGFADQRYYMPHHAVIKDSTTTKVRIVFDASTKTTNGKSLNEQMLTGPTLQPKLFATLLKWRKYRYAMTADIEKMYRMILVNPLDRRYQTILWRASDNCPIQEYQMNTVTFGTTSAPYLAIKTLQRLAVDDNSLYPEAAKVAMTDFYVDDVLTGADTVQEAQTLQGELIKLLKGGGFHLRKWAANHEALLSSIPAEDRELQLPLQVREDNQIKALGIYWHPVGDYFSYAINCAEFKPASTKRKILSEVAKLYDPLGWIAPCVILAKIIMQKIWMAGYGWDEMVDQTIQDEWTLFQEQLPHIQHIKIPRWVNLLSTTTKCQLMGFCDASVRAYGAVIYIRTTREDNTIDTKLLMSKTKVAPIKPMSLPRLELCGAVLLSRLMRQVKQDMNLSNIETRCWTDSKVVLAWIKGLPHRWKTFVANRVVEINENAGDTKWQYVHTKDNPADIVSRGVMPAKIQELTAWWQGPSWMRKPEEDWPHKPPDDFQTSMEAKNVTQVTLTMQLTENEWWMNYSSYLKTIRVIAYCYRFVHNARRLKERSTLQLSAQEINAARKKLIELVQRQAFAQEYEQLKGAKPVKKQSKLFQLQPLMAEDGTIRIGGRLQYSTLSHDAKHPLILPKHHHVTNLIIDHYHNNTIHGGAQMVLNAIRSQYWIINGMSAVKERIHKCVKCIRYRAAAPTQSMGNLPHVRVTQTNPFESVGIDYAGPIDIKMSKHRGSKIYKGYFCIFVCMTTKAIHIEVASDMSTDAFLAALRRFIGRRGLCKHIYSDNGTNFVGASKRLGGTANKATNEAERCASEELANYGIQWHFNPPAAPHFGGLWEAGVKSIKYHLKRAAEGKILTFEELNTLLIQIEACLNSRPLCPLSADPSNLEVLTPGHFLIGRNIKALPDAEADDQVSYLDRWKYVQQTVQQFWKQWSNGYLLQLQKRNKWVLQQPNLQIGQVVIIMDQNRSPSQWPLGIVEEIHPGPDGQRSDTSTDTNDEDDEIKIPTSPKATDISNSTNTEYTHNTLETEYTHNTIEKYSIGMQIDRSNAIDKFDNDMNKIGKSTKIPLNIEKQCEEKEVIIQQKKKYGTKQPSLKIVNGEPNITDSCKKLERPSKADDFDVFGDLVARKIRNLRTPYAQYTVQHLINNLLYEGELGKYNEPPKNKHARYPHECSSNFSFNPHFNPHGFQFSEHAISNQDISPNASTKLSSDYVTL